MLFCWKTVLQSVVACKGSDNMAGIIYKRSSHIDNNSFNSSGSIWLQSCTHWEKQNIYPCNKDFSFCLGLCAVYQIDG